jgi:hypothetical protein
VTLPPGSPVSGSSTVAVAPSAPGRLGEPLPVDASRGYLLDLGRWRDARKRELDLLDAAALRAAEPELYTGDVTLSMSLWQAVSDRYGEMLRIWDDGRADVVARDRLARLVWGRLETGGLGVNLVEATRLSDALVAQLRVRLSFDPRAAEAGARVAALRAALERLRELVKQEPAWSPQVEFLSTRVDDVASRAARGGDVDTALAGLEGDAARAERDLVVTTAKRLHAARAAERAAADLVSDRARAAAEVRALQAREEQARALAARCVAAVADAPRFAVPDVAALGSVPQGRDELDAYLRRLGDVARALGVVEKAYAGALAEVDELQGLLGAYWSRAVRSGRASDPGVATAGALARAALVATPVRLAQARRLVGAFSELVRTASPATQPGATS